MLQAVFTSDWHFDGLRNLFPEDHADRIAAEIEKPYRYAVKKGIKYVIVAGDISDSYKMSPESIKALVRVQKTYEDQCETYYLTGNHDYGDDKTTSLSLFKTLSEFKMLKNFHVIDTPQIIRLDGVDLNFCPFPHTELVATNKPTLNIIHRDVAGAVGDNGRELKVREDLSVDAVRDFTVSGHIHKHQYIKSKRVLYNGALFQKTFGESLPKGWVDLRAKVSGGVLKVKWDFIENKPKFRLETVHIKTQKDFSKLKVDPNIRYRLYIADSVVVPSKLRQEIPNIDQLWNVKGKSIDINTEQKFLEDISDLPKIDPLHGLKEFYKAQKLSKSDYLFGKAAVESALKQLGY